MARQHEHGHGHGHSHGGTFEIDQFAFLQSPIHAWDGRIKVVGLLSLIFAFALIDKLILVPAMVVIAVVFFAIAKIPWSYLFSRLKLPGVFIGAIIIFLPFVAGSNIIASLGPIDIRGDGLLSALLVLARFFSIFTLALVLFASETFLDTVKALRALKCPDILADMVLLTYRYLFQIGEYFNTMRRAARLRGFRGNQLSVANVTTLASLLGHMFVRSFEQSEQVYRAMVLRGYGTTQVRRDAFVPVSADYFKLAGCLLIAIILVILQYTL